MTEFNISLASKHFKIVQSPNHDMKWYGVSKHDIHSPGDCFTWYIHDNGEVRFGVIDPDGIEYPGIFENHLECVAACLKHLSIHGKVVPTVKGAQ